MRERVLELIGSQTPLLTSKLPRSRPRRRPERCRHHFVSHSAKEEGIGLGEVLDCVAMQIFVREHCTMIAAPVHCDVDGIPKGSHCVKGRLEISTTIDSQVANAADFRA